MQDSLMAKTVGELRAALADLPANAPIATLYDWGADVKYGLTVLGTHTCGSDCDKHDCSLSGHVVLDIDPRPNR